MRHAFEARAGARVDALDPEAFAGAVEEAAARQLADFLEGVRRYRAHEARRNLPEPPTVWQEGTTRVLDYGAGRRGARGLPVLAVPSLVNRAYVLDLAPRRSLLRHLAGRGFRPFLVDWGRPGPVERRFTLTDYVAGRLEAAFEAVREAAGGRPMVVLGYCMGGLLALALALRRSDHVAGLVLLATPWDFHAADARQARALAGAAAVFLPLVDRLGAMPVDHLQTLFAALDPLLALRKFAAFARMPPGSAEEAAFVALEDWANDGVELPAAVARECLLGWYGDNTPARGLWTVADVPVRPQDLSLPALVVVPGSDRIVPPASARALAAALPGADLLEPKAGHIGMVVGRRAAREVWRPLVEWLAAREARAQGTANQAT